MKLALIGFMGTGKSTVGPILAQSLGIPFFESDSRALEISGAETIVELFDTLGEEAFRDAEELALKDLAGHERAVISCGGGSLQRKANEAQLKNAGFVIVHLMTTFEEIKRRLVGNTSRPLFRNQTQAKHLYAMRLSTYEDAADITITTDGRSPSEVANLICASLSELAA